MANRVRSQRVMEKVRGGVRVLEAVMVLRVKVNNRVQVAAKVQRAKAQRVQVARATMTPQKYLNLT